MTTLPPMPPVERARVICEALRGERLDLDEEAASGDTYELKPDGEVPGGATRAIYRTGHTTVRLQHESGQSPTVDRWHVTFEYGSAVLSGVLLKAIYDGWGDPSSIAESIANEVA